MTLTFQQLIKDINRIDLNDLCSTWQWILGDQKSVILISNVGDMFLLGKDGAINWLDTGVGKISKVADSLQQFEHLLNDRANIDSWFLPTLVEQLIDDGKVLKENEVYSFRIIPALGGKYSPENFEPTDISVHFSITGQLHEQIKDLPEGTKINNIKFDK